MVNRSGLHGDAGQGITDRYASFSELIQSTLYARGITQRQAAEELGVTPQAVSDWVQERRLPSAAQVPAIAAWVDCTTDDIRELVLSRVTPSELARLLRETRENVAVLRRELDDVKSQLEALRRRRTNRER